MSEPHTVNIDDLDWVVRDEGDPIRRKSLGIAAGGEMIGCSLYELPPGTSSWPYHYHCANEEAVYVLEGGGTARIAGREVALRPGDYLVFPRGERGAHKITNDTEQVLRFLCISTMVEPEIAVYPDSGKYGLFAGAAPGTDRGRRLTTFLDGGAEVDYWKDEE